MDKGDFGRIRSDDGKFCRSTYKAQHSTTALLLNDNNSGLLSSAPRRFASY